MNSSLSEHTSHASALIKTMLSYPNLNDSVQTLREKKDNFSDSTIQASQYLSKKGVLFIVAHNQDIYLGTWI